MGSETNCHIGFLTKDHLEICIWYDMVVLFHYADCILSDNKQVIASQRLLL